MKDLFDNPQIVLDIDAGIDIMQAYSTIDHDFNNYFSDPEAHDLTVAFAKWGQLKEHCVQNGLIRVLSSYESTIQKDLIHYVTYAAPEYLPEIMATIATMGVVEPEMLTTMMDHSLDNLDIEEQALDNMLRNKTHLINTADRTATDETLHLIKRYLYEPQERFALKIIDDCLKHSTSAPFIFQACLKTPIVDAGISLTQAYRNWLAKNDEKLESILKSVTGMVVTDEIVQYLADVGAEKTASALFNRIHHVDDFRTVSSLMKVFSKPLSDYSIERLSVGCPAQLMMYYCQNPEYLSEKMHLIDVNLKRLDTVLPLTLQGMNKLSIEIDPKKVARVIDTFATDKTNIKKLYDALAIFGSERNHIARHSDKLKRINLERDFGL